MLRKCTYNSQCIANYAQVEPTIMLTKTCRRHRLHVAILVLHVLRFESGHQLTDQPFTSPQYVVQAWPCDKGRFSCVEQLHVPANCVP